MNYEQIKDLIDYVGSSKIDSLDIEFPDGIKISMKKNERCNDSEKKHYVHETVQKSEAEEKYINDVEAEKNFKIIKSPMVGVFYEKPSPDKEVYVKIGDKVKKGDILCIIEAMKLMNEIVSEYDGEIIEILVKNEEMVEFGKPLFKIK